MAVRYDRKFLAEINKVVKNYNAKINRLSKTSNDYILPAKFTSASLKALKASASTRADVRRELRDLQSFTAKGGEKNIRVGGTTIPKYKYTNVKRYQRRLAYQTTKKLRRYETTHPISGTKTEPFTFSQYGSQEYLTLKAKRLNLLEKDISMMTPDEIDKYLEKLKANTRPKNLDIWQSNYIDILQDTALSYGYDTDKLEFIVERLKLLSPEEFDDLSFISRNIKSVIYAYKALENIETYKELADVGEDVAANLDTIYENIDEIIKEYVL